MTDQLGSHSENSPLEIIMTLLDWLTDIFSPLLIWLVLHMEAILVLIFFGILFWCFNRLT